MFVCSYLRVFVYEIFVCAHARVLPGGAGAPSGPGGPTGPRGPEK